MGLDAAREASRKRVLDVRYEPKNTSLSQPKYGKDDPKNESHVGGNTWAGGVSVCPAKKMRWANLRDSFSLEAAILLGWAAAAGTCDYIRRDMTSSRLVHNLYTSRETSKLYMKVSDDLKKDVPEEIKEKARELARQELQRRLEELNMTASEAKGYGVLLEAVQGHIAQLFDLLERKH